MTKAADNRLRNDSRPTSWLVSYDMDTNFFNFSSDEQYRMENADVTHAVSLRFEGKWKAGFISTDFKHGYIVLDLGNESTEADADETMRGYPMYQYFLNLRYTRVFNATEAGFDWQTVWGGFKEYLDKRF